jgi:hypothetical protein
MFTKTFSIKHEHLSAKTWRNDYFEGIILISYVITALAPVNMDPLVLKVSIFICVHK